MHKNFASKQQMLMAKAFFGSCGEEFMGSPVLMMNFMEMERFRGLNFEDRER